MSDFRNDHFYEEALISTIIQDPDWTLKHRSQLSPVLFDNERCRMIFEAVTECGSKWDFISVTAALRIRGNLEKVGGPAGVSEFCNAGSMSYLAGQHLEVVRRYAILRRTLSAHKEAQRKIEAAMNQGTEDAAGLLSSIREGLDAAGQLPGKRLNRLSSAQAMDLVLKEIEERAKNPGQIKGVTTGFALLDKVTHGLQEGHLWVIAGEPGDGKSAFMQNILEGAALTEVKTAVIQLEMPIEEQAMRFLASDGMIDSGNILTGMMTHEEKAAIAASMERLKKSGTHYIDTDNASASDILADIEASDYRVVMLDYIQLLDIEAVKGESREQAISRVTKDLKNLAKRKKCTILIGSQLNDDGKLRESRAIGQHADKVIYVRKVVIDEKPIMTRRTIITEKNRGGPPHVVIPLQFAGASFRFRETTSQDANESADWIDTMNSPRKKSRREART